MSQQLKLAQAQTAGVQTQQQQQQIQSQQRAQQDEDLKEKEDGSEPKVRLILQGNTLPPGERRSAEDLTRALRENESLGYTLIAEMHEYLRQRRLDTNDAFDRLELSIAHPWRNLPSYHLVEVPQHSMFQIIGAIYRVLGDGGRRGQFVELVEPELALNLTAAIPTKIGTGFNLATSGSSHTQYKSDTNVTLASSNNITGNNTAIAVLDSGAETGLAIAGWHDLTRTNSSVQVDNNGHGSAMTAIISDLAPQAEVHSIRVTDSGKVYVWDLMAGLEAAVFHTKADIINMSLGLLDLKGNCGLCGGAATNRSLVFQTFLERILKGVGSGAPDPIFVAAVGNDKKSNSVRWPAAYDSTVAIGSVTHAKKRSEFSNTSSAKVGSFFLCPGGDVDKNDDVIEWVGEGNDGGTVTYCAGTSASTAYASAIFALYRHYSLSNQLPIASKDIVDLAFHFSQADVTNDNTKRLLYDE